MSEEPYALALIFTGHMIDLPGRAEPRFPADIEPAARRRINLAVRDAAKAADGNVIGIASAARGADVLFLEACASRGISTRIVLPKAPENFIRSSVSGLPDSDWEERFWRLWNTHGKRDRIVLAGPGKAANIYDACNRRMLVLGRRLASELRLLAFWNGQGGDGAGGTADFISMVEAGGGNVRRIHAERLLRNQLAKLKKNR